MAASSRSSSCCSGPKEQCLLLSSAVFPHSPANLPFHNLPSELSPMKLHVHQGASEPHHCWLVRIGPHISTQSVQPHANNRPAPLTHYLGGERLPRPIVGPHKRRSSQPLVRVPYPRRRDQSMLKRRDIKSCLVCWLEGLRLLRPEEGVGERIGGKRSAVLLSECLLCVVVSPSSSEAGRGETNGGGSDRDDSEGEGSRGELRKRGHR